jgi:hypothetical protein
MMKKHTICRPGAAVRLHGYMPAVVLAIRADGDGALVADVRVTVRRAGIGPHGYRPGELTTVRACHAIPRDIIRISRQHMGAFYWPSFAIIRS